MAQEEGAADSFESILCFQLRSHIDESLKSYHSNLVERLSLLNDSMGELSSTVRESITNGRAQPSPASSNVVRPAWKQKGSKLPNFLSVDSSAAWDRLGESGCASRDRVDTDTDLVGHSKHSWSSHKISGRSGNGTPPSSPGKTGTADSFKDSFGMPEKQTSFMYRMIAGTSRSFAECASTVPEEHPIRNQKSYALYAPKSSLTSNPSRVRRTLKVVVTGDKFDAVSMVFIIANGIFVGVHTELYSAPGADIPPVVTILEWIFTIFFFGELVLRMVAFKWDFFLNSNWTWNVGDLIIVTVSCGEILLVTFADLEKSASFSMVRLIRILRMFRVMRMIRVVHFFRELRILTLAILNALRSLVWALLLLVFIMYVVACIITSGVASHPSIDAPEYAILRDYWSTLPKTIFSLFMSTFGGVSWNDIVDPINSVGEVYVYVFVLFVAFTQLAVLNVVTGVFCENAIKSATRDDEEVLREQINLKEAYMVRLMKLFEDCKSTEHGHITLKDFEEKCEDDTIRNYFALLDLAVDDARTLFKLLDTHQTGILTLDEFVSGCLQLKGVAKSIDMAQLYKKINYLEQQNAAIQAVLLKVPEQVVGQAASMRTYSERKRVAPTPVLRERDDMLPTTISKSADEKANGLVSLQVMGNAQVMSGKEQPDLIEERELFDL